MTALLKYDAARAALAACVRVDDALKIRNEAERMALYARQAKDRDLMADAAEIQARAEQRLGALLIKAKDAGQISRGQPPKNRDEAEQFSRVRLEEVGIDRKLSAKAQKTASLSERAFEGMIEGLRGRILSGRMKIIGGEHVSGSRAVMGSRIEPPGSLDFLPTPPWPTRALIEIALPSLLGIGDLRAQNAWEPACGEGHIAEVLREYFGRVEAQDIYPYGYGGVFDFLSRSEPDCVDWIITNPPFGDKAEMFVHQALPQARVGVAVFVTLRWLETIGRYERLFKGQPPTLIAFFAERVPLCKGQWDPKGDTATAYIWLVWIRGANPQPPFWIPPGQREALTHPDDIARFTAHPVIRREDFNPETGEITEAA